MEIPTLPPPPVQNLYKERDGGPGVLLSLSELVSEQTFSNPGLSFEETAFIRC